MDAKIDDAIATRIMLYLKMADASSCSEEVKQVIDFINQSNVKHPREDHIVEAVGIKPMELCRKTIHKCTCGFVESQVKGAIES